MTENQYFNKIVFTDTYKNQREQMDQKEVLKFEQAMQVHGYRGSSKMKHNGVVNIKPIDTQLWKSINKFKQLETGLFLDINDEQLIFVADVKAVAHVINGNRAIGSIYKNENNQLVLYMLGFSNYNYQLF